MRAGFACAAAAIAAAVGCGEDRNYNFGVPGSSMSSASSSASSSSAPAPGANASADEPASGAAAAPMGAPMRRTDAPLGSTPANPQGLSTSATAAAVPDTTQSSSAATVDPSAGASAAGGSGEEEPFKVLARTSRFNEFRGLSARYIELRRELYPLGVKLADGSATDDDRKRYYALEARVEQAWKPINGYMWDDRWSEADRAAMGWILYGDMQPKR